MARYFFHVRDGSKLILDSEGVDLPDLSLAAEECRRIVREVLSEDASRLTVDRQFEITDAQGGLVLIIPFVEVP
jgi:hypothetical protein